MTPDPSGALRLAYADPPYPGMSRFYVDHPDYGGEVDHAELIERLCSEFPDGWALSTASTTLRYVLGLCPDDVRIAAWVKPFASFKPGVNPGYWYMDFVDVGVKYDGHWYDLEGNTESAQAAGQGATRDD